MDRDDEELIHIAYRRRAGVDDWFDRVRERNIRKARADREAREEIERIKKLRSTVRETK